MTQESQNQLTVPSKKLMEKKATIFVSGISSSTKYSEIKKLLSKFGPIKKVMKVKNKKKGSNGYFLVIFRHVCDAEKALGSAGLEGLCLKGGRQLQFRPMLKGKALEEYKKNLDLKRVEIRGIEIELNESTKSNLKAIFGKFGQIQSLFFAEKNDKDRPSLSDQVLYITYATQEGSKRCLNTPIFFQGRQLIVTSTAENNQEVEPAGQSLSHNRGSSSIIGVGSTRDSELERKCRNDDLAFKAAMRENYLITSVWSIQRLSTLILECSKDLDHSYHNLEFKMRDSMLFGRNRNSDSPRC